ncbi:MAG: DUF1624 domain-containing protein [Oscillospiraceae bacterium]|nr:DUF1624 domain-containing protein [Oscillospiraceae bacterium]
MTKKRVWELDALRGLCIIGMIVVHLFYDIGAFTDKGIDLPKWFYLIKNYGHILFVLISGICATLTTHSTLKRGLVVFGCGLLVSYVTMFMEYVIGGFSGLHIWFGILHMLGLCMLLYPVFRKLPFWALALFGAAFIALGYWMDTLTVPVDYLFPLGLRSGTFYVGSDYFAIFPGFGWFLIGAAVGKTAYRKKESLLPKVNPDFFLLRGLRFIGRHSLLIYLLHQPFLFAITFILLV